jgi:hypothetical protein
MHQCRSFTRNAFVAREEVLLRGPVRNTPTVEKQLGFEEERAMRNSRVLWLLAPVVGILLSVDSAWAQPRPTDRDVDAVLGVLGKVIATMNDAAFQRAPADRRMEMLRPFYRPDNTFAANDLPLYFGPLSEPVSRGTNAHLENVNLTLEWVVRQGLTWGVRIDEAQVEVGGGLAVVYAHTTSGWGSADGRTSYATRGRSTITMNKMSNGRWVISHEHTELYNPQNPNMVTKEKLAAEIKRMKPIR